ncbi:protein DETOXIFICATION 16-like isoform X2 [Mercurialis annua]|uniref:protein DETOXIFICATION 16-like isoform X2 n=1 Tax=Mercurialis annua TaxID=3986 RepID=UPI00215F7C1B|nr:protein DETOXIFICATION 16-like isoform X2 [Mercurialis annua]
MDQEELSRSSSTPLIVSYGGGGECDENNVVNKFYSKAEIITELKKQMRLAGPLIAVSFFQYSLQMISVMFVGHLGELSLAGASMATSFAGVTGFCFLGMGSALETFTGQAYGAKQYHMLGVHLQRAIIVLVLITIPISFLWAYSGHIFTIFGLDMEISNYAQIYILWLIPTVLPFGILQCLVRFLQAQKLVLPLLIGTGISSLMHIVLCWTLIFRFGFGHKGAALSIAISYWINVLFLAMYIKFSPACEKTWIGFSKAGRENLLDFIKLGIPSALMICVEFWSYESLVLMSGLLPNPKLETSMMSISLNTSSLVFRIPFGLASVVSTRVSNELGAGKPQSARLAVHVVIWLVVIEGVLLSLSAVAVRNIWGYLFTKELEVVTYLAYVMPILAASNFIDGIQGVLSGVARGCGWQKIGAYVNLGAYYLAGVPCAIVLAFVFHFGGKGLWMGIITGSSLQAFLLLVITMHTNWEIEAKMTRDRVYASNIRSNESDTPTLL